MNILLIGSGGREHALAWKIKQGKDCGQLYIAPGNAGTASLGINIPVNVTDFEGIKASCLQYDIGMVIVGPEEPLVKGICDFFQADAQTKHIRFIGPSKQAAQLEGSKAFAKSFMQRHNIPTARYGEFTTDNYEQGIDYIKQHNLPIVLKADGLAAGKGVMICQNHLEALSEYELMLYRSKFGEAGKKVVVEEFLTGIELSVFVLTDGQNYIVLPSAKDYKRIGEGDTGLNTGGMGAVSPVPFADEAFIKKVTDRIIIPTIEGLKKDQLDYKGFIFIGLMNDNGDPQVIEYNCRMGDPETEVVIPRIKSDLVEVLNAVSQQRLNEISIDIDERTMVAVVAVSGGYPGDYGKGLKIEGLDKNPLEGTIVFQCGTREEEGEIFTNGGRVLAVTSYGDSITEAVEQSVYMLEQIHFNDMYYRSDIGYEFRDKPGDTLGIP